MVKKEDEDYFVCKYFDPIPVDPVIGKCWKVNPKFKNGYLVLPSEAQDIIKRGVL